jgi:hypothetical protein
MGGIVIAFSSGEFRLMGQTLLQKHHSSETSKKGKARVDAAEAALATIAARESILNPHLAILDALCNNTDSDQQLATLRFCSYLLQNSSLEKLQNVEIVANWYSNRTEVASSAIAVALSAIA